jgi:hypothetical protein
MSSPPARPCSSLIRGTWGSGEGVPERLGFADALEGVGQGRTSSISRLIRLSGRGRRTPGVQSCLPSAARLSSRAAGVGRAAQ